MRLPTFSSATVLASRARIVDLRSPSEFAHDHLPGAESVPLFDDEQRAIVGTLYKQDSPSAAYEVGLRMVEDGMGERLARILQRELSVEEWRERFRDLAGQLRHQLTEPAALLDRGVELASLGEQPIVLHCWRGGMRSQSVALLLRALGEQQVGLLDGGYKGYRRYVLEQWNQFDAAAVPLVVLRGATGVGKTRVLRELEARAPGSTIDLEGLAGHRSSVLGAVGLEPRSQPAFEGDLLRVVQRCRRDGPVFVEGESRKVGDRIVPGPLFAAMEAAPQVKLTAQLETRLNQLGADYLGEAAAGGPLPQARLEELAQALGGLRQALSGAVVADLQQRLLRGDWRSVTQVLLERHYDPLYAHGGEGRDYQAELAVEREDLLDQLLTMRVPRVSGMKPSR